MFLLWLDSRKKILSPSFFIFNFCGTDSSLCLDSTYFYAGPINSPGITVAWFVWVPNPEIYLPFKFKGHTLLNLDKRALKTIPFEWMLCRQVRSQSLILILIFILILILWIEINFTSSGTLSFSSPRTGLFITENAHVFLLNFEHATCLYPHNASRLGPLVWFGCRSSLLFYMTNRALVIWSPTCHPNSLKVTTQFRACSRLRSLWAVCWLYPLLSSALLVVLRFRDFIIFFDKFLAFLVPVLN